MPFNYRFKHLCGSVYSRGNVAFTADGNALLSPVGNRVTVFDLVQHTSHTLPFEARKGLRQLALSNDSRLLLAIDDDGMAVLVNVRRRIVLHRFSFRKRLLACRFVRSIARWSAEPVSDPFRWTCCADLTRWCHLMSF